uniref:Uncharacterized protein n=1 Tax=Nelumbo nucifera TaxID=4432 RepID=A0A822YM16_NELNU|nr:TPA_asm: hypothetical protein HUJ06_011200 [Nelumbo nucifera]
MYSVTTSATRIRVTEKKPTPSMPKHQKFFNNRKKFPQPHQKIQHAPSRNKVGRMQ